MTRRIPIAAARVWVARILSGEGLRLLFYTVLAVCAAAVPLRADQVVLQNGDRYNGTVLSLTTNSLTLRSEVIGTVILPRNKVAQITLGSDRVASVALPEPAMNSPRGLPGAPTNVPPGLSAPLHGLGADTNLVRQVQARFLSTAGPEANSKFNELMGGLMSGRVTVDDIRAEARSAANQLRTLKRDLGPQAGSEIDEYLSILDGFLQETTPPGVSVTNAISTSSKSGSELALPEK